jgi:hypothetical protein
MTDQQRATICSRCGGLRDRCECAEIRREAFAEAARYTVEDFRWSSVEGTYEVLERLSADFAALARKPGPV